MEKRYSRQVSLEHIGTDGMLQLASSSVLVIGVGGLGCPILQTLVSTGIGTVGFVDFDVVEETNLARQILFENDDIGQPKVFCAERTLAKRAMGTRLIPIYEKLNADNALAIIENFDVVVDATDNFEVRYIINDACAAIQKKWVFGAIYKMEAQVAVFNADQQQLNLRDIYPMMPDPALLPACEDTGVLASATAIVGNIQAQEVIFLLLKKAKLVNTMLVLDLYSWTMWQVKISKNLMNPLRKNQNLNDFSEIKPQICERTISSNLLMVNEISVSRLKEMMDNEEQFWLVDVREQDEFEICSIGGELIPVSQIGNRWSEIPSQGTVVLYCRSGVRSANVIRFLQEQHGYSNLLNLTGGILAWSDRIDPTVPKY